jgi:guanidinopropionase
MTQPFFQPVSAIDLDRRNRATQEDLKPMTQPFFQPVSAIDLARFAGIPTFMRLPSVTPDDPRYGEVQLGLVGLPWDGGTTNRPGARHGRRQLRDYSTMIRAMDPATGVNTFAKVNCADLGDVPPNPVDILDNLDRTAGSTPH